MPAGPSDGGHGEWAALAVGWALSTLEPQDEDRFALHLPGCEQCAGIVRESLHTVADLAYGLPDAEPPPALKMRIMEAVRAEPRRRPGAGAPGADVEDTPDQGEWPLGAPDTDWFARPESRTSPPQPTPRLELPRAVPPPAAGTGPPADVSRTGRLRVPEPGGVDPDAPPGEADRPADLWTGGDPGTAAEGAGTDRRGRHAAPDDGDRSTPGTVVPVERPARRWARWAAAAAVVALLAALGGWNLKLRADQDDLRQVAAQRTAEIAQRDALVAQRDAAIRQLTANGPARIAALTADGKPSDVRRATIVVRGDQIEIITEALGASAANSTYWLWTLRCDTPAPTDLRPIRGFTVPQAQFSVRSIGSDPGFADAQCFAISEEIGTAMPTAPRTVVAVGQPE
jgi:hypothetical protein